MGWKKLEERVIDYRKRNNLPPGDPWTEITTQACAAQPDLCYNDVPFQLQPDRSGMDFNNHVIAWLGHAAGYKRIGQWNRIDDATAARRAQICATCPFQRALASACGACIASIDGLRKALLDGQKPKHRNLSPCSVTFEDCQSTVHVDMPPNPHPGLPGHCWRRP